VGGDGMVKKAVHVKQGDLSVSETPVFMLREPKNRARAGVRAAIVVRKRRNGRGAKGRRKVKA
jgi:hypothetical protein